MFSFPLFIISMKTDSLVLWICIYIPLNHFKLCSLDLEEMHSKDLPFSESAGVSSILQF